MHLNRIAAAPHDAERSEGQLHHDRGTDRWWQRGGTGHSQARTTTERRIALLGSAAGLTGLELQRVYMMRKTRIYVIARAGRAVADAIEPMYAKSWCRSPVPSLKNA